MKNRASESHATAALYTAEKAPSKAMDWFIYRTWDANLTTWARCWRWMSNPASSGEGGGCRAQRWWWIWGSRSFDDFWGGRAPTLHRSYTRTARKLMLSLQSTEEAGVDLSAAWSIRPGESLILLLLILSSFFFFLGISSIHSEFKRLQGSKLFIGLNRWLWILIDLEKGSIYIMLDLFQ